MGEKTKMPNKIWWVLALAVVMLIYTVGVRIRSNFNFGILLLYLITAGLFGYSAFYQWIDRFCEAGFGKFLKILFFCGLGLFAVLLGFVAVSGYSCRPGGSEKAVVVLGAGLKGERPSGLLQRRLNAAFDYWQEHPEVLVVVTGGQGRGETIPEGVAMARYLKEKGIPEEKIIVEKKSTSTEENLLFAKELLAQKGISENDPIAVVTNAFHCYRGRAYARQVGFSAVTSIPASISIESIPVCYMREVFALLYYWVFRSNQSSWILPFVGIF